LRLFLRPFAVGQVHIDAKNGDSFDYVLVIEVLIGEEFTGAEVAEAVEDLLGSVLPLPPLLFNPTNIPSQILPTILNLP
jgi:hypothetical protein